LDAVCEATVTYVCRLDEALPVIELLRDTVTMQCMPSSTEDNIMVDSNLPARRSLRVAVVTETYPPEVNGVSATIARVVEGMQSCGHELQLVRPRQDAGDATSADERFTQVLTRGLPIPRYPQLKMGLPCKGALVKLWTTHPPDVVHIVTEGPLGWSALQVATRLQLPIVSDFRTNFHAYSRHYGIAWMRNPIMAYLRTFHNRCFSTMVPTEGLRSELAASGFKRLRVVSRGVDTRLFDPARRSASLRAQWSASPQTMVVLYVGRLAPEKNLGTLLNAFQAMRAGVPGLRMVLVGDGPDKARLMQLGSDAVFAGVRRGEDLATHYASADVFLFPSVTETFGNVVPEAMASGLAVVGYDYAAAGQLIRHGENGLLARYDDSEGFRSVAQRLAGDLSRARALGAQARIGACRLDWGRIVEAVEAEYLAAMLGAEKTTSPGWRPALPTA
jgi:glycosyltransferase involved in cell wall biosynthesis